MGRMHFEYYKRLTLRGWRWYFRIVAGNGRIIAQSEGYVNKGDALATIRSIETNIANADILAV